ncbi:MAG: hypothetical protein ABI451_06275 [Dokdonella sp.]
MAQAITTVEEMDFRTIAREALAAAGEELAYDGLDRSRYAALHLRMAFEALTYERAVVYRTYLPMEQLEAWQPRQVLKELLEIDSLADQGGTLYLGLEDVPGVAAKNFSNIGTEYVLSFATIKKHYDALGSFLHIPSIKQLREGKLPDLSRLRDHCNDAADAIKKALSSRAFGMSMGIDQAFPCERCGKNIVRRTPLVPYEYDIKCSGCRAVYNFKSEKTGEVEVRPNSKPIDCLKAECDGKHMLWGDEFDPGHTWKCERCGTIHELVMRVAMRENG